jgi:hypothetical protein
MVHERHHLTTEGIASWVFWLVLKDLNAPDQPGALRSAVLGQRQTTSTK